MRASSYPATAALCALIVLGAILSFTNAGSGLVFLTASAGTHPWTAITYPFVADPISALVNGFTLWSFGRAVESEIGSAKMAGFAAISVLLAVIGIQIGAILLGQAAGLSGAWPLAAAIILAWSVRYPRTPVRIMFFAEVEGRWLGLLAVAFTLFAGKPYAVAPFSALALPFAWAFAANKISLLPYGMPLATMRRDRSGPRGARVPRSDYFDDVKRREKEREERERLRKLFEGSVSDDDKNDR